VYVWRDEQTGDVVLSTHPGARWSDFVALRDRLGPVPEDFLTERAQSRETRDPLGRSR